MTPNHRRDFLKQTSATAALGLLAKTDALAQTPSLVGPQAFLCVTCATQFTESVHHPEKCPICEDERQYVGPDGQKWTTFGQVQADHKNRIVQEEPNLHSINTEPKFGIGQRAFLIQTSEGNILWDCVGLIDEPTTKAIQALGGIQEIAISHPHYYTAMIEWSRAFGNPPIHIHEAERPWVMRPDPAVHFWSGESLSLRGGTRLIRTGGHFEGYQVLHWPAGAGGKGCLMAGDQPQICMDPKQVSFMYSYPNFIPLNPTAIHRVVECLEPLAYDRVYGAFVTRGKGVILSGGKEVVTRSAQRYLQAIHV